MGRWAEMDSDAERLPEGMVRIGYDADSQQYTFRDSIDGSVWESAPGCQYGRLTKISQGTSSPSTPTSPHFHQRQHHHSRNSSASSTGSSFLPPGCEPSHNHVKEYDVSDDVKDFLHGHKRQTPEKDATAYRKGDNEKTPGYFDGFEKESLENPFIARSSTVSSEDSLLNEKKDPRDSIDERYDKAVASLGRARKAAFAKKRASTWNSFVGMAKGTFDNLQQGTEKGGRALQRRASVWISERHASR